MFLPTSPRPPSGMMRVLPGMRRSLDPTGITLSGESRNASSPVYERCGCGSATRLTCGRSSVEGTVRAGDVGELTGLPRCRASHAHRAWLAGPDPRLDPRGLEQLQALETGADAGRLLLARLDQRQA